MKKYVWYYANEDVLKELAFHPLELMDDVDGMPEKEDPHWQGLIIELGEHVVLFLGEL